MSDRTRVIISGILLDMVLLILAFIVLFPIGLSFIYSLTSAPEITELMNNVDMPSMDRFINLNVFPKLLTLQQYVDSLLTNQRYLMFMTNSMLYSFAIILGQLIISPIAAFAFAKGKFKFRDSLFFVYIVVMMMPFQVTMIANYIMLTNINLMDTSWAIILPGIFTPFSVFLMRQYMVNVPDEIIEAATIDGSGAFRIFIHVMLPMVSPGIAAMVVLSFAEAWNLIEQPLLFLTDVTKYPLSLALSSFDTISYVEIFANSVIFMLPTLLLFLIFQDDILRGIETFRFK